MKKKLDLIIVVDIEATCWDGEPPSGQQSEIIEIGVCPLEVATLTPLEKHSIIVKPQHSSVSEYCTQLTTLTQQDVDSGISFEEACALLKKEYRTKHRTWASYGDYDRRQFEKQCAQFDIPYPFGPTHINVKNLFALVHKLPREVGMAEALNILELPLRGTHHRGHDDAQNIAGILSRLLSV